MDRCVDHMFGAGDIFGTVSNKRFGKEEDGVIKIWDIVTGKDINDIRLPGKGSATSVKLLPCGLYISFWEEGTIVFGGPSD